LGDAEPARELRLCQPCGPAGMVTPFGRSALALAPGTMRAMRWWVIATAVLSTLGGATTAARPVAHVAACAAFGTAAGYDVFSNGELTMSGTTDTGRIAAAGDVSLTQVNIGTAGKPGIDVYAGGNLTAAQGTVENDARYGGTIALNGFTIKGTAKHPAAGEVISFGDEFNDLAALSSHLATQPGTTVIPSGTLLTISAPAAGLNVVNITAADLNRARAFQISGAAGATLLINVKGPVGASPPDVLVTLDYMALSGISAPQMLWNFTNVNQFKLAGYDMWKGTLLAPATRFVHDNYAQDFNGQVMVKSATIPGIHPTHSAFAGCLPTVPPPEPGPDIQAAARCVDVRSTPASLVVRLTNRETKAVDDIAWNDLDSAARGTIPRVAAGSDYDFAVPGGSGHTIRVTAGTTKVETKPTSRTCEGTIEVTKQTVGDAPGGTWPIAVLGTGHPITNPIHVEDLGAGESFRLTLPGGFVTGVSVPIGGVAGGATYSVTELDPRGGTATVSLYPVVITDSPADEPIPVVVTNTYPEPTPTPEPTATPTPEPPPTVLPDPGQPTLPPGAPDPPPGPDLLPGSPGQPSADLQVTHSVAPRRVPVGATVRIVTHIRNRGSLPAAGVVARELPQYPNRRASHVAQVISLTTSGGACQTPRPVSCALGTLAPGQEVVIRAKARVLVAGSLHSVVFASGTTPESNTTNNVGIAALEAVRRPFLLRVGVDAPARGHVGVRLSYRVAVTAAGRDGARNVRLCTRVPATFTGARAPGTFGYRGMRCRDYRNIPNRATRGFLVHAVPAAARSVRLPAVAAAPELRRATRGSARVRLGAAACGARVHRPAC
jgi:choice-of-anchor A domain-containing protein